MNPFLLWFLIMVGLAVCTTVIFLRDYFKATTDPITHEDLKRALLHPSLLCGINIWAHLLWPLTVVLLSFLGVWFLIKKLGRLILTGLAALINMGR